MYVNKILLSLLLSMSSFSMQPGDGPAAAQRTSEIPKEIVTSFEAVSKQGD